jgi:hypothetical protein
MTSFLLYTAIMYVCFLFVFGLRHCLYSTIWLLKFAFLIGFSNQAFTPPPPIVRAHNRGFTLVTSGIISISIALQVSAIQGIPFTGLNFYSSYLVHLIRRIDPWQAKYWASERDIFSLSVFTWISLIVKVFCWHFYFLSHGQTLMSITAVWTAHK